MYTCTYVDMYSIPVIAYMMCVYMYVCVHVCMYTLCMYIHYACIYVYMYTNIDLVLDAAGSFLKALGSLIFKNLLKF